MEVRRAVRPQQTHCRQSVGVVSVGRTVYQFQWGNRRRGLPAKHRRGSRLAGDAEIAESPAVASAATGFQRSRLYQSRDRNLPRLNAELQLGVFRLSLFENRDVGVGVLPHCEEGLKAFLAFAVSPASAEARARPK